MLSSLEYSIFIKALNIYAYFGGFLEVYSCTGDSSSKRVYSFKENYSFKEDSSSREDSASKEDSSSKKIILLK